MVGMYLPVHSYHTLVYTTLYTPGYTTIPYHAGYTSSNVEQPAAGPEKRPWALIPD